MAVGGIGWFARHEWRLAWRDWRLLMGRRNQGRTLGMILGVVMLLLFLHGLAAVVVHPHALLAANPDREALTLITGTLVLSWSLMLSQAMEAVTRAFYARGDLELILSSPVESWRLFAVRIIAMAATVLLMSLVLTAPFINVLAWRGGPRWLSMYLATMALAMIAVAVAIVLTVALFRTIGAKRTRVVAQVVAAFIGAIFVISLQFAAILSYGTLDRLAFLSSEAMLAVVPDPESPLWGLARAAMGAPLHLAVLMLAAGVSLAAAIWVYAPRFGPYSLAAASVAQGPTLDRPGRAVRPVFRTVPPARTLRRKEWVLLFRDPWLVSQTLVQILYLLPAAYLLWSRFDTGFNAATLLVPVLITASGQFSGGLAWLAISGEDAPDLIQTAPIAPARILRAKFEAVLGGTLAVFSPFLVALLVLSIPAGLIALIGILVAGGGATAIQHWYRLQAQRGRIRRRMTASRLTTYAEALSSIGWAATAAMAAADLWLVALVTAGLSALVVFCAWRMSPARAARSAG